MDRNRLLDLLRDLACAHSPGGDEGEIDRVLLPHFRDCCRDVHQDAAENIIGVIPGRGEREPLIVTAHKDEVGMIVKRVEGDGTLRVEALGGVPPWKYGEGPVDILAPGGPVPGVLSIGSFHTTAETPRVDEAKHQPLDWSMLRVLTRRTAADLEHRGIGAGTRVVVARARKALFELEDCICGYGLDDKAALAVMLDVMVCLRKSRPAGDVYFVASSSEEQMGCGATFATGQLPAHTVLSLEIGPVAAEYGLELDHRPIVWYRDSTATYTKSFSDELCALARTLGFGAQKAVYDQAGSDASCSRTAGQVGRVAVLAFPGINSHGFEVAPVEGILNMHRVLLAYLLG